MVTACVERRAWRGAAAENRCAATLWPIGAAGEGDGERVSEGDGERAGAARAAWGRREIPER